jgi:hypothetical protein
LSIVWKNLKSTHREKYRRKASKGSTDGRALQKGKIFIGAFEIYNTKKGQNEFCD